MWHLGCISKAQRVFLAYEALLVSATLAKVPAFRPNPCLACVVESETASRVASGTTYVCNCVKYSSFIGETPGNLLFLFSLLRLVGQVSCGIFCASVRSPLPETSGLDAFAAPGVPLLSTARSFGNQE